MGEHYADEVVERLADKTAVIGVVGLGYVGLPLCLRYLDVGYRVVGFDVDENKTEMLMRGESYIQHIDSAGLRESRDRFSATTDFSRIEEVDAIILCVPTPLTRHREPDLSYVISSLETIVNHMRPGQVVSLESTTYPGTTDEELAPRIEQAGFSIGRNCFVVYSPEREDPGNPNYTTSTIPKVVSGITDNCKAVGHALYAHAIDELVMVSNTRTAEMTKILENTYRAVNIALVNELKLVSHPLGVDIFEAIRAAATKPFGFTPFYPGPGLGGHCIPIDPFYLTWKAREFELSTEFIELAGEVNTRMPRYVVARIGAALNNHSLAVKGSSVLILGVAYKKNVDDLRESPSIVIIEKLQALGAKVDYSDPHVPQTWKMRQHSVTFKSVPCDETTLKNYDCVVVCTDHDAFDWEAIGTHAKLLVDTRGRFDADDERIFRA